MKKKVLLVLAVLTLGLTACSSGNPLSKKEPVEIDAFKYATERVVKEGEDLLLDMEIDHDLLEEDIQKAEDPEISTVLYSLAFRVDQDLEKELKVGDEVKVVLLYNAEAAKSRNIQFVEKEKTIEITQELLDGEKPEKEDSEEKEESQEETKEDSEEETEEDA